jgi:hypothetical protein
MASSGTDPLGHIVAASDANMEDHALAVEESRTENVGLLSLPPELLSMVAQCLSRRAINRLARSCRFLHNVINPELYRHDREGRNRALWFAVFEPKAVDTLRRVLEYCPEDVNLLDQHYWAKNHPRRGTGHSRQTPLMAAIRMGNLPAVHFLVSRGADISLPEYSPNAIPSPHIPSWYTNTALYPIHYAASRYHRQYYCHGEQDDEDSLEILHLLLASGADPNQLALTGSGPKNGSTPLKLLVSHQAYATSALASVISVLLAAGAFATRCDHQEQSPLFDLMQYLDRKDHIVADDYQALVLLVGAGAGSGEEADMRTPFIELLSKPRTSNYFANIIEHLLHSGLGNAYQRSSSGEPVIVKFLRGHIKWDPMRVWNPRPNEVKFSFEEAAETSCLTINHLLAAGADIDDKGTDTSQGEAAIHVAVGLHWSFESIFKHLVKKGAKIRARRADGCTILHTLVQGDDNADPEMVTHLIKRYKVPRHARSNNGNTFLHFLLGSKVQNFGRWAKQAAKYYTLKDLHTKNQDGRTPLHMFQGRTPLTRYRDLADAFEDDYLGLATDELKNLYDEWKAAADGEA